jgi:hypothetical protein
MLRSLFQEAMPINLLLPVPRKGGTANLAVFNSKEQD